MRRVIAILLPLLFSQVALADDSGEIKRLQGLLNILNQQQQVIYQQFQMVQELRRAQSQSNYGPPPALQFLDQYPNYDEVSAAREYAIRRESELTARLGELYEKFNEIEESKKSILDRLYELTLSQ
jgi:hypothetical protein